jgi:hypothetical protein
MALTTVWALGATFGSKTENRPVSHSVNNSFHIDVVRSVYRAIA